MMTPLLKSTLERIRPLLDELLVEELTRRWAGKAKRPGSLGRLESLMIHYGLVKGTPDPAVRRMGLAVFASDHGIVHEGVTAEAQDDTQRQVRQFLRGGSAASVLCRNGRVEPVLVNAGVCGPNPAGALDRKLGEGSANLSKGPALTVEQLMAALDMGIQLCGELAERFDVVGLGQLGVGGSCAASAMLCAASGRDISDSAVREAGLDDAIFNRRIQAIRAGLHLHQNETVTPLGILRTVGGLDQAAMTGFILGAAALRLPVIVDGFTAGAAALCARALAPDSLDAVIFSHLEPQRPHAFLLRFLSVEPLLDLQIEEGSGFGAALGLQMLATALCLRAEIEDPGREFDGRLGSDNA
jgi:nicotinate-nucleotide--dimethylbenzimidazole phosphoribosyltransferase